MEKPVRQIRLMIGLPSVGKSTYIEENVEKFPDYEVIAADDITKERCRKKEIEFGRRFSMDEVRDNDHDSIVLEFDEKIRKSLDRGDNIIIERTNVNLENRSHILNLVKACKKYDYKVTAVVVLPPEESVHVKRLFNRAVVEHDFRSLNDVNIMRLHPVKEGEFDHVEYIGVPPKEPLFHEYIRRLESLPELIEATKQLGNNGRKK